MPNHPSKAIDRHRSAVGSASIPDGCILTVGPGGEHHIVPEYLIPATRQAFALHSKRNELDVRNEEGGVSPDFHLISMNRCPAAGPGGDPSADADAGLLFPLSNASHSPETT
jgi:hypothetical protein